jgi:uncharacterized protein YggU (UPF0235/DUF167 family)
MYIKVRVNVDSRAEKVIKKSDDLFVVSVKESAERGMANKRILEIFRKIYPNQTIKIVSGHLKPAKVIEVR